MSNPITSLSYGSVPASSASAAPATTSSISYDPALYFAARAARERSFLRSVDAGLYIGAVLLGIHTITLVFALIGAQRHKQTRQRVLFSAIPVVLWATALVFDVCSFVFSARALDAGEDTRSQHTYWEMHLDAGLNVAAGAAFFVSTVVTDGFLYGRCVALWSSKWCTVLLGLVLLASYALDILQAYWIGAWGDESLWVVPGFSYTGVISAVLAQALDVLFVVLLLARLATTHRKTGEPRVGAIGLVVESALLYGAVSVVWLGTFSAQSVVANAVLPMYVQLQGITVDLFVGEASSTTTSVETRSLNWL